MFRPSAPSIASPRLADGLTNNIRAGSCIANSLMDIKQTQQLLQRIRSNSELLTLIDHRDDSSGFQDIRMPKPKEVCAYSACRLLVQTAYLLYTTSTLKVDVCISTEPTFSRRGQSTYAQPRLCFYLAHEQQQSPLSEDQHKRFKFMLVAHRAYNDRIVALIQNVWRKMLDLLSDKPPEQTFYLTCAKRLLEFVKKHIEPKVLDNPEFPVIKHLETTELFARCSDLLGAYRSSVLFQIKRKEQVPEVIRSCALNVQSKMHHFSLGDNYLYIYKAMDNFLFQLVTFEVLHLDKSYTRFEKANDNFFVGYVQKVTEKGKELSRYYARFFTNDLNMSEQYRNQEEIRKVERNIYSMEYEYENNLICVRLITSLEANTESIDIISAYCANISFHDSKISMETIDTVRNPLKSNMARKYAVFKSMFKLDKSEEPFTKFLLTLEYVTLCARVYSELITKKPAKDQTTAVRDYMLRLDHLVQLFIPKAEQFYKNL